MFCTRAGKSAAEGKTVHMVNPSLLDQDSPTGKRQRARAMEALKCLDWTTRSPSPSCCQTHTHIDSDAMGDIEQYHR